MFCLSVIENNSDKASLQGVDSEYSTEEESLSSSNEKYKPVFQKGNDTISIVNNFSVTSEEINYKKMFLEGEERQKKWEKIGNAAKKTQVNTDRALADGTVLPWGSIVVLKMPKDHNDFSFPNLPFMVIGINHYKKRFPLIISRNETNKIPMIVFLLTKRNETKI